MKKSVHLACLLACGAFAMTGAAQAATTWNLKDVTFSMGSGSAVEQATGWFTYDEASNTFTGWDISVTSVGGVPSSFTFDHASLTDLSAYGGSLVGNFRGVDPNGISFVVSLNFAQSLAAASGDVALQSGAIYRGARYTITSSLVGGSITTSPVPEVGTGVAFAMGLLGLVAVARRRQA